MFVTVQGHKVVSWAVAPGDVDSQFVVTLGLEDAAGNRRVGWFSIENAQIFAREFLEALDQAQHYEDHRPWQNN